MLLFCKKRIQHVRQYIMSYRLNGKPNKKGNTVAKEYTVNWTLLRDIFRTVMKRYYIASFWSCLLVVQALAQRCCQKETKVRHEAGHFVGYIECVELFEFFGRWIEYKLSYILLLLPTRFQVSTIAWNCKHMIWNDGMEA